MSRSHLIALRTFQLGGLVAVLASVPFKLFDLDRFFVPKELAVASTALLVTVLLIGRAKALTLSRVDELLVVSLGLTGISTLFSTNWWLAERSLVMAIAGALCFWCARKLAHEGGSRSLVAALALAGVVGAVTALLQAYGLRTELFSLNRAPGGTFGNRNFMAHLCVIALPAILFSGLRAPTQASLYRWCGSVAAVGAALTLSRTRAAWLALIAGSGVVVIAGFIAMRKRDDSFKLGRLGLLAFALFAGAGASLAIPNTLDWKSDSPYLETAQGLVNYKGGSGHGRLIQYGNSLKMSLAHPLLGVGPGNWAVVYPRFASRNDPSLGQDGMTSNPWPSSDWVTFVSERGIAAASLLAAALLWLLFEGIRGLRRERDTESRLASAVLLATLVTLIVVGMFDAVLLLPVPTIIGWGLLGALAPRGRVRRTFALSGRGRAALLAVAFAIGGAAITRSAMQLAAMSLYNGTTRLSVMERAQAFDPGSFRIRARLAEGYARLGECKKSRPHGAAAKKLFPYSPVAKRLDLACKS